jgi:hypothetical protein
MRQVASMPKNDTAAAAIPLMGRLWLAPSTLMASTCTVPLESANWSRVQPGCGSSVEVGVWLRPNTFVQDIWPGLDASAAGYHGPAGQAQRLTVDLREPGITGGATARLFADTSATDGTLRTATVHGTRFALDTAAFGGFLLVLRPM